MMWKRTHKCTPSEDCTTKPAGIADVAANTPKERVLINQIQAVRRRQDETVRAIEHHLRHRAQRAGS